ncbi:MAG: thioesterase family protein [Acidobacteriota bacterium]
MHVHETRVRVRYAETDQMGVVYYSNYFVWMEVGRLEYCKSVGFNYRDMEIDDGVFLAVVEAQCRYRHPARFDDELIVRTSVESASPRGIRFAYEIRRAEDQRLLATGQTSHLFCGRDMRPVRLPDKYHARFEISAA